VNLNSTAFGKYDNIYQHKIPFLLGLYKSTFLLLVGEN